MIDWLTKLFFPSDDHDGYSRVDSDLLFQLREELNECEAIYRAGAHLCQLTCPERIDGDPKKFLERMIDLHRGLLIKVFIEISQGDRAWHPEEREVALELLHHVWGVNIGDDKLSEVLRNVADLDKTLKWESLLGPFVRFPALTEQRAELQTCVMRIANLVVKADGHVLPDEAQRLSSIQEAIATTLRTTDERARFPLASVAQAGEHVAQLLQTQPVGRVDREQSEKSTAGDCRQRAVGDHRSPAEVLTEAMAELNGLIGLEALKDDVRQLVNFLKIQDRREQLELLRTQIALHTVFCGNPGTGKTTVARILGRLLHGLQILEKGHTVETDRSGLVAEYAGQTGPKVSKRIDEALDGVLFIDEAYSLVADRGDDPFGNEAVQVLLKRMEDDRKRIVIVLAGYPVPMNRMLVSNPGLASRFQRTLNFPDYTADELLQIFESQCARSQYVPTSAAREKLKAIFQSRFEQRDERFGNARLSRNLFEYAIQRMANRIVQVAPITRDLLTKLEPEDIPE